MEGLYEDIGERMVGDIDFICSPEDYPKAIQLLEIKGYYSNFKENNSLVPEFKHYPKLINENKIAAVEIHKELLNKKYAPEFNYNFIKDSIQILYGVSVLSFEDQLSLSIAASHINNNGFEYKSITLRNAYDVFLLSKKTTAKNAFKKFNNLENILHSFLASCYIMFNKTKTLQYTSSKKIEKYLIQFNKFIDDRKFAEQEIKKRIRKRMIYRRLEIIFKSFFYKKYRTWLYHRITDKNWRKEKLIQLGLKKP